MCNGGAPVVAPFLVLRRKLFQHANAKKRTPGRSETKHTAIAAKLRVTAAEMEAVAALGEDMDYPVEFVPSFILNWVTDPVCFWRP
jgi:hypothetical protein